jgi:hypothetical protein
MYAVINVSTMGDNIIVAGVANKLIRVIGYSLSAYGAVGITWKAGTAAAGSNVAMEGPLNASASGWGQVRDPNPNAEPLFTTSAGDALNLNLSAGVQVTGSVQYSFIG